MKFNAYNLDRKIEIWRKTVTQDSFGQKVENYGKLWRISASKEDVFSEDSDGVTDQQIISSSLTFFVVRFHRSLMLKTSDEVRFNGKTYEIVSFSEIGRSEYIKIKTIQRGQYD
jgi:hypothetical protein